MTEFPDNFLIAQVTCTRTRYGRKHKCGARTRSGKPCRAPGNGRGGRCKLHGGKSTGPRTPKGREKARQAVVLRWAKTRSRSRYP